MAAQLREHHDTWLQTLRTRLAALQHPDPDLSTLLPEYLERCERRLSDLDIQLAEVRRSADYEVGDVEELETYRDSLAYTCNAASRLMVH